MAAISQTIFSNAFLLKMFEFPLIFHWSLFPIDNISAIVWIMAWRQIGKKPLADPMVAWFTDAFMRASLGPNKLMQAFIQHMF